MTRFGWALFLGIVLLLGGGAALAWYATQPQEVACTMEAKVCPDGSSVGRMGPNCEFAECPTDSRETITDAGNTVSFKVPVLTTTYITAAEWPPKVAVVDEALTCDADAEERTIDGRTYCVTLEGEGAAGSVFSTYAYAFEDAARTITLSFTLRATQCANYDEPKASECQAERDAFSADALVANIVKSMAETSAP